MAINLSDMQEACVGEVMDYVIKSKKMSGYAIVEFARQLEEFASIFYGVQGIESMASYIRRAEAHDEDVDAIYLTIMHDVHGRHGITFCPRSSGY